MFELNSEEETRVQNIESLYFCKFQYLLDLEDAHGRSFLVGRSWTVMDAHFSTNARWTLGGRDDHIGWTLDGRDGHSHASES